MIAQYQENRHEKYTTVKIGDRIERFDGPLSDLVIRPIRMSHELAYGRKITLELTFDLGFVLKIDGQEFDGMLARPTAE